MHTHNTHEHIYEREPCTHTIHTNIEREKCLLVDMYFSISLFLYFSLFRTYAFLCISLERNAPTLALTYGRYAMYILCRLEYRVTQVTGSCLILNESCHILTYGRYAMYILKVHSAHMECTFLDM